jgi:hypothetical protein
LCGLGTNEPYNWVEKNHEKVEAARKAFSKKGQR